jgi:ComF family protein
VGVGGHLRLVPVTALSDKSDMVSLTQMLRPALDFVLPERCPGCGVITPEGGTFCVSCWQRMRFLGPPWCSACALPFAYDQHEEARCADCLARPPRHDGIRAAVVYDDISRQVVLKLKYGGKIGMAKMIAAQLLRHLPEDKGRLIVTPVPLHWTRLWTRSFNQSALIGSELARLANVSFIPDMLLRTKRTPSLRGLAAKERRRTLGRAFAVNPRWQGKIEGSHIILVDDVLTTGATSDGCVKALKKAGADWVQLFCWARALRGEAAADGQPVTMDA